MTRDLRSTAERSSGVSRAQRGALMVVLSFLAVVGVQAAATATPSPSASPTGAAQLSHTVTVFGIIFFAIAAMAVVMFIIVVLRLRKS